MFRATAVIILFLITSANAGPFEDGSAAERRDDCATANSVYRKLAEQGDVRASNRLGYFFEIGYCAKRDWLEAAKWFGKGLFSGDETATMSLGYIGRMWRFMYPKSPLPQIIYETIEKAAEAGNAVSQFSLANINYPIGDPSFDESKGNLREALKWYQRAADQGDVDAMAVLGLAYFEGVGVRQDYVEAHSWYNLAASRTKYSDIRNDLMKRRDDISIKMSPAQLSEAQKLAREWRPNR